MAPPPSQNNECGGGAESRLTRQLISRRSGLDETKFSPSSDRSCEMQRCPQVHIPNVLPPPGNWMSQLQFAFLKRLSHLKYHKCHCGFD